MTCLHQFFSVDQIVKPAVRKGETNPSIAGRYREWHGARIVCALCTEVRSVWENGEVLIEKVGPAY